MTLFPVRVPEVFFSSVGVRLLFFRFFCSRFPPLSPLFRTDFAAPDGRDRVVVVRSFCVRRKGSRFVTFLFPAGSARKILNPPCASEV